MDIISEYCNQFEGIRREWIEEFTTYMSEKHKDIPAVIWFRMPTYKIDSAYIAFSITKDYFGFHTNDKECFSMLSQSLDKAGFGKRSVRIKFTDEGAKTVLFNTIEYFVHKNTNRMEGSL